VKSFWLDIDCGPEKPYLTQRDGLVALYTFCKVASLPAPSVVNSGNGLYAHWVLSTPLSAFLWKGLAELLKKVVAYHDFAADPSRTSDLASVLRPIGSHNKKNPSNWKQVKLVKQEETLNTVTFARAIKAAFEATGEKLTAPRAPTIQANAEFLAGLDEQRPSSAELIAGKCNQIATLKVSKGNIAEPLWYASIGLLRFTTEAPEIIHEWSAGHSDYSRDATETKISNHERSGVGPTTCAKFSAENADGCKGCRYAEKITSPITLGYTVPKRLEVTETGEELPTPPKGFTITVSGMYADGDVPTKFYDYPVYVSSMNIDHFGESFTLKHKMKHEGWQEVTMASNKICKADSFFPALMDAHIHIIGKESKGLFMAYIETFMSKLRADQRLSKLSGQMGWHSEGEDLSFIHGDAIYRKDGSTQTVGYSATAPEFVKSIKPSGDMSQWVENTKLLNAPGLEGLAFEFICTAFGSPLVRFSGYEGAMLSIVGGSGLGKTLTGKWGLSAWGDPNKMLINQDDTTNVTVGRLGTYNTLPAYIDEVSNITPENLSHLAYRITQGRDKVRMDRNAKEKSVINTWNLLATVSSNHSLMDKLLTIKGDPGPEFNRIFEYEIADDEGYSAEEGKQIFDGLDGNYGQVGKDYALWLVQNQDKHRTALEKYTQLIAKASSARPDERFWVMTGAVAVYGATVASSLGLCHVNIAKLLPWIVSTIKAMRKYKDGEGFDAVSFIGSILDRHNHAVLCVASYDQKNHLIQQGYREPKGKLVARIELDRLRLWLSADTVRQELSKMHLSVRKVALMLKGKGLISTSERVSLGRGTIHQGVAQVAWTFDLNNPELKYRTLAAINEIQGEMAYGSV
jgi:hypothetical protein